MDIVIYHNPRCSKSRKALALLNENDVEPSVVHYLETPPDVPQLTRLLELLGLEPRALLRRGEDEYKELGLDDTTLNHEQLIAAMVSHPKLIERPIVVAGERAVVGRPPERVLELL